MDYNQWRRTRYFVFRHDGKTCADRGHVDGWSVVLEVKDESNGEDVAREIHIGNNAKACVVVRWNPYQGSSACHIYMDGYKRDVPSELHNLPEFGQLLESICVVAFNSVQRLIEY